MRLNLVRRISQLKSDFCKKKQLMSNNFLILPSNCLGGGIGRRAGFKIQI
jgi:uncharacterized protein (DUF1919 family)